MNTHYILLIRNIIDVFLKRYIWNCQIWFWVLHKALLCITQHHRLCNGDILECRYNIASTINIISYHIIGMNCALSLVHTHLFSFKIELWFGHFQVNKCSTMYRRGIGYFLFILVENHPWKYEVIFFPHKHTYCNSFYCTVMILWKLESKIF